MIRYECNECGEIIEDEESMLWVDITCQYCEECRKEEEG